MGPVKYVFLRLYGANLERRARNQSGQACSAAITQTILTLIIPCSAVAAYAVSVIVPLDLESLMGFAKTVIFAVAVLLGVLTWSFRRYADTPSVADEFRTRRSRRLTWLFFYFFPLFGIGLFALVLRNSRN